MSKPSPLSPLKTEGTLAIAALRRLQRTLAHILADISEAIRDLEEQTETGKGGSVFVLTNPNKK